MTAITIGVPVHNGADLLDEALADIAAQSFTDFEVLIFDNASSDGTGEIARAWAARDPRFHYVRQPENVGVTLNFVAPLEAATTQWFMWHAHDDLSAPDYIEKLFALASRDDGCVLAVGTIVTQDLDGGRRREHVPPFAGKPRGSSDIVRQVFGSHPSWFYGLWRREALAQAFLPIARGFPYAFAADHLTLYGPMIAGRVAADPGAIFIQRYRRVAATPRRGTRMPSTVLFDVRRRFRAELRRIRSAAEISLPLRAMLRALDVVYLHHALPSVLKMWRTRVREWLGLAKASEASRHISAPSARTESSAIEKSRQI